MRNFLLTRKIKEAIKIALFFPLLLWGKTPPDYLSFSAGAFDIVREKHRTFEFAIEGKFLPSFCRFGTPNFYIRPLVGVMATAKSSVYLYGGINFDLLFTKPLIIAPGFALGGYFPGNGKRLGYPLEFRSGVEVAYQLPDWTRIGIHFYHLSNAHLGHRNPGEESLTLFIDLPINKNFPFK